MTDAEMLALIQRLYLLETRDGGDAQDDEDVAEMETISHAVHSLPADGRRRFVALCTAVAAGEKTNQRADLIRAIPRDLGLT